VARKSYKFEEIITKLREAEILLTRGMCLLEVVGNLGIDEATYYRWRKKYHSIERNQMRRLKEVEKEKSRIRMQYPT
jgi:putative transposase